MNVSLDLFIEREPGDHGGLGGLDWVRINEPLARDYALGHARGR
jgi:hypothetical protein